MSVKKVLAFFLSWLLLEIEVLVLVVVLVVELEVEGLELKVKKLTDTAKLPEKAHQGDLGYDVFADEDICLSAQNQGFINILSPKVHYIHDQPSPSVTRGHFDNQKDKEKVSKIFENKWGFPPIKLEKLSYEEKVDFISRIESKYQDKLTWTKNLYSYEWIYLNN